MIAGGVDEPLAALKAVRARSAATIVMKRGPMGCVVFPGEIPDSIEKGVKGPGFPVEVYNVLGAGDAFMSGFLRGWLRDEPTETCCAYANAGGAFAVSRLLCSAEYPTWPELRRFLDRGSPHRALRRDEDLNHIHWATTRRAQPATIMALAIDHRAQLEKIADEAGASRERIGVFKRLAVEAAAKVADGRPGYGMLLDGKYGREALFRAADHNFWIGRPVEEPGSRPLDFEFGGSLGAKLIEWPIGHTIKCLCFYHPDDPEEMKARQERELSRLYDAARTIGRELLIEIIASKNGPVDDDTIATRHCAPLWDRHQARLVEAGGAGDRRGVGADRRGDRRRRSAVPRHHGARPRGARGGSRRRVSDRARRASTSRASRSGARYSSSRPWPGSRARSATPRRCAAWPTPSPACARSGETPAARPPLPLLAGEGRGESRATPRRPSSGRFAPPSPAKGGRRVDQLRGSP